MRNTVTPLNLMDLPTFNIIKQGSLFIPKTSVIYKFPLSVFMKVYNGTHYFSCNLNSGLIHGELPETQVIPVIQAVIHSGE